MTEIRRVFGTVILLVLFASSAWGFSFAVFGDRQDRDQIYIKILESINSDKDISFVVNVGDFAGYGKDSEYKRYINTTKKYNKLPVYNVIGNHDAVAGGWKLFAKYFGPSYYSFNYENCHFVFLDDAFKQSFDEKQFNWLVNDLKSNKMEHTFVFFHKPTFDVTGFYDDHVIASKRYAEKMMDLFERYKVNYVITGHIHGYARTERDGVIYMVSAGAGAPLYLPRYAGGFYHYVKITVNGGKITDEIVKVDE